MALTLKPCSYCGDEFTPLQHSHQHCSTFCRFWSKVEYGPGCWPWQAGLNGEYGTFRVDAQTIIGAHVFACDPPDGLCALHKCDNPPCCRPSHLWAGTRGENATDRRNKGREGDRAGAKNGRAKLTPADVMRIRVSTESGPALADRYGVKRSAISKIRRRMSWAN